MFATAFLAYFLPVLGTVTGFLWSAAVASLTHIESTFAGILTSPEWRRVLIFFAVFVVSFGIVLAHALPLISLFVHVGLLALIATSGIYFAQRSSGIK